ncbi:MAG: hypothetical protein ACRDVC_02010 [Acidimicrobiales bacterium]
MNRWRCTVSLARRILLLSTLAASFLGFEVSESPASASPSSGIVVSVGEPLTNFALGLDTQIQAVDMLSPSLGYGVADDSTLGQKLIFVLVRTTDGGRRWTMRGLLVPENAKGNSGYVTSINFVNPRVGYVVGDFPGPNTILMTINAGRTWRRIHPPGRVTGVVMSGSTVVVVTDVCAPHQSDTYLCPDRLTLYRVGTTSPVKSVPIPKIGKLPSRNATPLVAASATEYVMVEGDSGGGGQAASQSILQTTNAGSTWNQVSNPCGTLGVQQLISTAPDHWLLSCFLGEGMNQGKARIYRTNNGGATWTIVALDGGQGATKGNIGNFGDEFTTLTFSRNHRVLFGTVGGARGGLQYSTDEGVKWVSTPINGEGGDAESISTFGPAGAVDVVVGSQMYRTTNGTTWSLLPALPAARYEGMRICTASRRVTSTFVTKHVKGSRYDFPVVFTNDGDAPCYLAGSPTVQPEGRTHRRDGLPAYVNGAFTRVKVIVLKPHGGTASISLLLFPPSTYRKVAVCGEKRVGGFRVTFNSPSNFYVPLYGVHRSVCTSQEGTASVSAVVAGRSGR